MMFKTKCKTNLFQYGFSYKNLPAQSHYTAISREKETESQGQKHDVLMKHWTALKDKNQQSH